MDKKKKRIIIAAIVAAVVLVAAAVSAAFIIDAVKEPERESRYSDISLSGTLPSFASTEPNENTSEPASSTQAVNAEETTAKETTTKKQKPEKTTETSAIKYDPRYISLKIMLPQGSALPDSLEVYINGELVLSRSLRVDGKSIEFVTDRKYEGDVEIYARLVDYGTQAKTKISQGENSKSIVLPRNGTEDNVVEDE